MVQIREMQIDDLEQVMDIENESFSTPWTESGFFSFLIREDTVFLVAEEEGRIIGYCGAVKVLDEGDITNVAVMKNRRNQGIGRMLVDALIRETEKAGVSRLFLEVRVSNESAAHLYRKLGFETSGLRKNYYESPTEDALVMMRVRS